MEELARLKLYNALLDDIMELRNDDYLVFNDNYINSIRNVLRINIYFLDGIEEYFLTPNDFRPEYYPERRQNLFISDIIRSHISDRNTNDFLIDPNLEEYLITELENACQWYEDNLERRERIDNYGLPVRSRNSRWLFYRLIMILADYNNRVINYNPIKVTAYEKKEYPQVFLSHAYDDKLYGLALFEYFRKKKIWLYVDWMNQGKQEDGNLLKKSLSYELRKSRQLVFLRSPKSELSIQGGHVIRPWCSWELGNFYGCCCGVPDKRYEMFLLNLYSVRPYDNPMLQGMNVFTGVDYGWIQGKQI